jgi:hypothetical protein
MSHIAFRTGPLHILFVAGLTLAASLVLTSTLWANGPGGSRGGSSSGSRGGSSSGSRGNTHGGSHNTGGSKGNLHNGRYYQHNVYSKFGLGWSRRCWCPELNCLVYWSPPESCWYTYDATAETFVPVDTWTTEFREGIQYGP